GAVTLTWSKVSGPGTASLANPGAALTTATFSVVGTYVLRLTASDGALSAFDDLTINVNLPGNNPPVILSGPTAAPNPAPVGQTVTFTAIASDADGDPLDYLWDFGDGEIDFDDTVTHVYASAGMYTVTVTVDDGVDEVSASMQVEVDHGLSIKRHIARLNFAQTNKDKFALKTTVVSLPLSFLPAGAVLALDVGGASLNFTLDSRGRGSNAFGSCKLRLARGVWTFTVTQRNG